MLLSVERVNYYYGEAIHALRDVSFGVEEGEIASIIGANGAGKSTLMWTLVGLLKPKTGTITFDVSEITNVPAHRLVRRGVGHAPEGRRIFSRMTVLENLQMGAYTRSDKAELQADFDRVFNLFPRLRERSSQAGGTLSGGEQQMLAIARGLMSRPKLLLLDEPSLGLAPVLVHQVFDTIQEIARQGTTILLVEQNALKALEISARAYVLEVGRIVLQGTGKEFLHNSTVQAAYLGVRQRKEVILEGESHAH